ncbi:MAG: glycosyltransferase family 39 protein [Muribaculaceae bacterium]|jgi:4-amino-4-deoxy-L-arabinose transferase-like glycosyltransferase|nr:glycosyltransferase family 39 protein [Muribaculaceae bacterium]
MIRYFCAMKFLTHKNRIRATLLFAVCIFTFFVNNSTIYPDIMECRNIVTAREMVYSGHWLVPTMNGDLRLEKPPLPTWLTAFAEVLSPDNLALQRAFAGIAASLLILFFFLLGRDITHSYDFAWISSLILCTSYNIVLMGRTASWDIYCHAFMMGAIYFIFSTFTKPRNSWPNALLAGVFLALSFMSKGPVSFYGLLLPFIIAMLVYKRPLQPHRSLQLIAMIMLFLAIGSLWYVYIYAFHPDISRFVLGKESSAWLNHNVRPWYYYWSFFLETGVWALLTITALAVTYWKKRITLKREYLFVFLWLAVQIVLLSCFPEKKKRYLLPTLIPCAYLIGFIFTYWHSEISSRADRLLFRTNACLIGVVCLLIPVAGWWFVFLPGYITLESFIIIGSIIGVIACYIFLAAYRKHAFHFVYCIVALFLFAEAAIMPFVGDVANNRDFHSISATRSMPKLRGVPFFYVNGQPLRIEIVYEAHRCIRPINLTNTDSVMRVLPAVILTHGDAAKDIPAQLRSKVNISPIGHFDNNMRSKGSWQYRPEFIYDASLLTRK